MPQKKRAKVTEDDVGGLKYFDKLQPLLARLHDDACQRDRANNRTLDFDQYVSLILLYLFNPTVSSLRAMEQASELKKVQKKLGCARASLGSLSEAAHVFNPELLAEVVEELGVQLQPIERDTRLASVKHTIELVDGTLLKALPQMIGAMWYSKRTGEAQHGWRLHTQFELARFVPTKMSLTHSSNSGPANEGYVLQQQLESDRCDVMDRGYARFTLFNAIHRIDSSYVGRIQDDIAYEVIEDRLLSSAALEADVLNDQIVRMGKNSKKADRPDHTMRLVCVKCTPHPKRRNSGVRGGPPSDGVLRIVTNLLDVPAEVIALIFAYRWSIELFFRFFKHVLGCRHLLSHSAAGIEIQTYCAIIACMLIALYTGRKPTLRTYEMICFYFTGLADEDELWAHIAKLKKQD